MLTPAPSSSTTSPPPVPGIRPRVTLEDGSNVRDTYNSYAAANAAANSAATTTTVGTGSPAFDGTEFCEIKELPSNIDPTKLLVMQRSNTGSEQQQQIFFCEMRDVLPLVAGLAEPFNPGDEVTFYGITATATAASTSSASASASASAGAGAGAEGSTASSPTSIGVALYPQLQPRPKEKEGIVFKRTVNSDLKAHLGSVNEQLAATGGSISGFTKPQGIIMAKGPNEDGSSGFPAGWRAEQLFALEAKKPLAWKHLLDFQPQDYVHCDPSDISLTVPPGAGAAAGAAGAAAGGGGAGGEKTSRRKQASTAAALREPAPAPPQPPAQAGTGAAAGEHTLSLRELEGALR